MENLTNNSNGHKMPVTCAAILSQHGFDSFTNSDDSTSFELPVIEDQRIVDHVLITVAGKSELLVALGY